MRLIKLISILIISFALLSCDSQEQNDSEDLSEKIDSNKSITIDTFYIDKSQVKESKFGHSKLIQSPNVDSLYKLLKSKSDFIDFYISDELPLLFFRSGSVFKDGEMDALILSSPTDSTYRVEIFSLTDNEWFKNDEVEIESFPIQFDIEFKDFNFDGFKDIYIQCSASNGYSISRGHLILIDKDSNKMSVVEEARELGNITPDCVSKRISTEEVIWCKKDGMRNICKSFFQWKKGKLQFDKKTCPCETE
jgi:hypothetical protein